MAESLTGGLIASRLVNVPGASAWFRGGVVAYHSQVKFDVLGVPTGPVVTEPAAAAMAEGCRRGPRATSVWASPGWPDPTSRRAWPRHDLRRPAAAGSARPNPPVAGPRRPRRVRQYGTFWPLTVRRARLDLHNG